MPWLRIGDTFPTDPLVLALDDPKDPMLGPACRGFFVELGALSAENQTDYIVTAGFVTKAGGQVADRLLRRCVRAGLLISLGGRGQDRTWKIIDNRRELIHIRLRDEVEWEKQQKADTRSKDLQIPVLLRDGDACRWCGVPVQPFDTRSRRGRSFDHLRPGTAARGAHDLVVACLACNGRRGRDWTTNPATPDAFAARWAEQLRPVPRQLIFVRRTAEFLADHGHPVPPGSVITERAPAADPTTTAPPQTSGPDATHPAAQARVAAPARSTTAPDDQHPATQVGVAAPNADTTPATRPASQPGAAAPRTTTAADQHPAPAGVAATASSTTAPGHTQHPATAGVAGPESRATTHPPTDRSEGAPPGRVGPGRVGTSGPTHPPPEHPPSRAAPAPQPRPARTRRGRRRPRTPLDQEP